MFSFREKPVRHFQFNFLIKTGGFYAKVRSDLCTEEVSEQLQMN